MREYMLTLLIYIFTLLGSIWRFYRAEKHLYLNEELFTYTPEHDVENVKKKHRKIWLCLFAFSFFPLVLIAVDTLLFWLAPEHVYKVYYIAKALPTIWIFGSVLILSRIKYGSISKELNKPGKVVSRYMVYSHYNFLVRQISALLITISIITCTIIFVSLGISIEIPDDNMIGILFIEALGLAYLANYAIIRYYYFTPRELVLSETTESEYDKAAKRYYGIWRNRLILANLVAGAQLILGGFVTLTNAGEHLMGIRILGLVLLVIVFTYILIQSREFDDPVVVKGMVYPSEKKRKKLKWLILSAIIIYAVGAIILL